MMENHSARRKEDIAKLAAIMREIRIAMLTTVDASGELRSRPMATQEVEFDGDLWFFTNEHAPKVGEVMTERHVNVSFVDPSRQRYVSVSGLAIIVSDHAKMAELWRPAYKSWFPKGLEDPEIALMKIEVTKAEYWDTPPSAVVQLGGLMKAAWGGDKYDPATHQKVDLR